jgi:hypothetical protein
LLALPVTMIFQISRRQVFQGQITLKWAFGLIGGHFPLFEAKPPSADGSRARQIKTRTQRHASGGSSPLALIRNRSFRQRIFRFVSDVWRALEKSNLTLRIRLGLGDPADTGQLWAFVGPVAGILANVEEASLEIEPDFMDEVFELDSSGTIRFIPLHMLFLALTLLLSPTVWQGIRKMQRG